MKIGFDAKRAFKNSTGLGNYSRGVIQCLAKNSKNSLLLYSPRIKKNVFKNLPHRTKQIIFSSPFSNLKRLLGPSKSHELQIYHGLSNELPLLKHSKMVVTIHDLIFKSHPEYYKRIDRWIYHFKTKNAIKKADVIICTSKQTSDAINLYYPNSKKMIVAYQHCSWTNSVVSVPLIKTNYLLYISSFEGRKNHINLLRAFHKIAQDSHCSLVLVGRPKETLEEIKAYIQTHNLTERVLLKPNAKLVEIMNYLQNATGFVYPSLVEGFGIPLLEAMHFDLPIAASDIPVFREIGQNQITYFNPRDVDSIKNALFMLLDTEISKSKPKYDDIIAQFSEENHQKKLEKIYQELI